LIGLLGIIQVGVIAGTKVPEASKGRYNVIGEDDGKKYDDIPYEKNPRTGVYIRPTLFAETGHEIIINPADTRELQMNYPEVIDAIKYVHTGQHASGSYEQVMNSTGSARPGSAGIIPMDVRFISALEKFNDHADKGLTAVISYDYDDQERAKVAAAKRDVGKI
jgi:hypothetical protein